MFVYDDYNSKFPEDQDNIGTLTCNIGNSTLRNGIKLVEITFYGEHGLTTYDSTERYPKSVWTFAKDIQKSALHPTQKPVALIEELIKTYTNQGDLVLDSCAGSCTTAIAAINTNRDFICFEKDKDIFEVGNERVLSCMRRINE